MSGDIHDRPTTPSLRDLEEEGPMFHTIERGNCIGCSDTTSTVARVQLANFLIVEMFCCSRECFLNGLQTFTERLKDGLTCPIDTHIQALCFCTHQRHA